jgi:hypothetical protein
MSLLLPHGPKRLLRLIFSGAQVQLSYGQIAKVYWQRLRLKLVQKLYDKDIPQFNLVQKLYGKEIPSDLPSSLTFNGYYPRSAVPSISKQFELLVD